MPSIYTGSRVASDTRKGYTGMENGQLVAKVTLNLDEKWAANLTQEELTEYITTRLNHALGFRGQVKKLKTVSPK